MKTPVSSAVRLSVVMRPGATSCFPASAGTQYECSTALSGPPDSCAVISSRMGWSTGMTSSFAVMMSLPSGAIPG